VREWLSTFPFPPIPIYSIPIPSYPHSHFLLIPIPMGFPCGPFPFHPIPIPNSVFYSYSHGIPVGFPVPLGIPFPCTSLLGGSQTKSRLLPSIGFCSKLVTPIYLPFSKCLLRRKISPYKCRKIRYGGEKGLR